MEPEKRIAELEAQVRDLTRFAEGVLREHEGSPYRQQYERIREKYASSAPPEAEPTPGHVWIERLAALLGFAALVFMARFLEESETIGDMQKLIAGAAISLALLVYGGVYRKLRDLFAETLTGCGLGGAYLTLYAAPPLLAGSAIDAFAGDWWFALLGAVLLVSVWIALMTRSFVIAAITVFVPYLTVIHGFGGGDGVVRLLMLSICPLLALSVLMLHLRNGWTLLVGLAALTSHGVYDFYLLDAVERSGLQMALSLGGISICTFFFALAFVWSAMRFGCRNRIAALTAFVNSAAYFILVQPILLEEFPEYYWKFCFVFAGIHGLLAAMTERRGNAPNPLLQAYLLCMMLAYAIGLSAALEHEWLAIAHAATCLVLVVLVRLTGVVVLKAYALLFTLLTTIDLLGFTRMDTVAFRWEGYPVPANWFAAASVTLLLVLSCWFSEHFVRRRAAGRRITNGQHAFAGTFIDVRGPAIAVVQATAIAVILLTMTIFQFGEDLRLPFILCAGALAIGVAGLLLFAPPLELTSVLLLAAGHVCYHAFLWLPQPGFETQPDYVMMTGAFTLTTYLGAYAWERYLNRFHFGTADWEHHAITAFPYLAATAVLAILLVRGLAAHEIPAALGIMAAGLLSVGALTRLNGVKASGVAAVALAAYYFQLELYAADAPITGEPEFIYSFGGMLATFVACERLFVVLQHYESFPSPLEDALRSALVFLGTVLAILGLQAWQPGDFLVHLLLAGLVMMLLGALFREWRYWWAALATSGVMLYWAAANFAELSRIEQLIAVGAFLLVGVTLLQVRARRNGRPAEDGSSHG